jgi:hypothetical protein
VTIGQAFGTLAGHIVGYVFVAGAATIYTTRTRWRAWKDKT